jgi:hypothetical protein
MRAIKDSIALMLVAAFALFFFDCGKIRTRGAKAAVLEIWNERGR